jgi:nucleoside 2-deoxyribosyltransferase
MKIFFTGSIMGGRGQQPEYAEIMKILKQYGEVSSEHIASNVLSEYGETHLEKGEILNREMKALEECDIVIAEVTRPSLGVGYLLGNATILGKKVIAFYNSEDVMKLSEIIKGDENIKVNLYKNTDEIRDILKVYFTE